MTLLMFWTPRRPSWFPTVCVARCNRLAKARNKMSLTNELFPQPLGPVITVTVSSGMLTLIPFKLFCFAPITSIDVARVGSKGFFFFGPFFFGLGFSFFAASRARRSVEFENGFKPGRRVFGIQIAFLSVRYAPVTEARFFEICSIVPLATICPPFTPAFGPKSMISSALSMTSLSCSTTSNVLPKSRNR